ncbi:MAG: ABC transporter ATP-binding protein [Methanomassiliicoccales archaeon]|nr:MAG: ABC transporter ATP-binding protein [Methanomassiliicoccales archaeon]
MNNSAAPPTYKIAIQADGLYKSFEKFQALSNISFYVKKGEIFGLLGPNGAGKTTCMKIFGGILLPSSGRALIDGIDVVKNPILAKSKIGFLPEYPALFEHISGREFLTMMGKLRGMEKGLTDKRVEHFIRLLDLKEQIDYLIGTYSKGMRQKIAFSGAIIHEPDILILDEPTSGLDPRFAKILKDMIKGFIKHDKTILMSTHITTVAESLCDRVAIINNGKIASIGTIHELKVQADADDLENAFINIVGGKSWDGTTSIPQTR